MTQISDGPGRLRWAFFVGAVFTLGLMLATPLQARSTTRQSGTCREAGEVCCAKYGGSYCTPEGKCETEAAYLRAQIDSLRNMYAAADKKQKDIDKQPLPAATLGLLPDSLTASGASIVRDPRDQIRTDIQRTLNDWAILQGKCPGIGAIGAGGGTDPSSSKSSGGGASGGRETVPRWPRSGPGPRR